MAVDTYLQEYAARAASALGPGLEVSITVREHGITLVAASSAPAAARCDQAEVRSDEGPCIDAATQGVLHVVQSVADDHRWEAWRKQSAQEGFTRSLAVPAPVGPAVMTTLNVYTRAPEEWTASEIGTAQACAGLVASAVRLHLQFAELEDAAAGLYRSMSDAAAVERAVGALMANNDWSRDEAHRVLRSASRRQAVSERDVAESFLRALALGARGDITDEREP
ncbi:ANTAR domain-containing protein [Puerhibacterium sp. TATVAM-FAB25]|uniref:ANTAR domain-containing protein n=1 Tax=Puerhibacterium sp. TATVAM-FAB25 TaxID=3093699 RepID=UPI00397C7F3E